MCKNCVIMAIETNVKALLELHPNPRNFIETLRNEAIDQAFRELSNQIEDVAFTSTKMISETDRNVEIIFGELRKIYSRFEIEVMPLRNKIATMEKYIDFLEKRTHHLAPKIEE